jgi:general secretion pathway protein D
MLKHSLPSNSFQTSRKILLGFPLAAVLFAGPLLAGPDENGFPGVASDTITAELIRRQAATTEARLLVEEGDRLMADEKLSEGVAKYRQAAETLPEAPMTSALRQMAAARLANASLVLARRLGSEGNFPEANAVIDTALIHSVDHPQLLELRKQLLDPNYYNPAMTPEQKDRIRKINTLFERAEGFMDLGQPDPAMAAYNQILGMDPTNTAARRGLERCERYIINYQKSARDHTRAKALREVDAQWETAAPTNTTVERLPQEDAVKDPLTSGLTAKLRGMVFPRVSFDGATLDEVVQYLSSQTKLLDPEQRGVNLVLRLGQRRGSDLPRINIDVNNVPLDQVLVFVTEQTGTRWQIVDGLVVITGLSDGGGKLVSRTYPVPPDFLSGAPVAEAEAADPFATSGAEKPPGAVTRVTAKSFLEASGVKFPAGAKAEFLRTVSKLVVFNTEENHDIVQGVLDQITSKTPRQALIRVSLLQASENHLEELGFDWLLGAFNIGTSGLFGSGGSNGNSGLGGSQASDWSAFSPTSGTIPTPIGQNPITAGNRSSTDLQSNLSIDDVLAGVRRPPVPPEHSPSQVPSPIPSFKL